LTDILIEFQTPEESSPLSIIDQIVELLRHKKADKLLVSFGVSLVDLREEIDLNILHAESED